MRALIREVFQLSKRASRRVPNDRSHIPNLQSELAIEIDHNGSPVGKGPAEWFVCFVPGLQKQWWHRFANRRHQHVFALKVDGDDQWIIFEPWWTRIMVTTLAIDQATRFLRWGALGHILKVTERIPGNGSQSRGWSNCSVLTSLMLGRSYWTWTPHGLYQRLLAEDGVEQVELAQFLETKLISMTQSITEETLGDITVLTQLSPEAAFMELGRRISRMMFSPKYLSIYRFVMSEAPRFPDAAKVFFKHGPQRAASSVAALISHFLAKGRFQDCDQERAARAFLSMLQGNLHLEIVLGCRSNPDAGDLESRTKSVVETFLRGVGFSRVPTESSKDFLIGS